MPHDPISVYLHFPFCSRRCDYCDFNTYANVEHLIIPYINSMMSELVLLTDKSKVVHSLYLGGGTPSFVTRTADWKSFFQCVKENYSVHENCKSTIEVNPGTVTTKKFDAYRQREINRLSIGMQSAVDQELNLLIASIGLRM